jgi:hypothetical protein
MRKLLLAILVVSSSIAGMALPSSAAKETGVLSADPARVSFGRVVVGSTGLADVVISNNGTDALVLRQAAFSGSGFSTAFGDSECYSTGLPAGGSCQLRLTFAPAERGGSTGTAIVSFATEAALSTYLDASVRLHGVGTG